MNKKMIWIISGIIAILIPVILVLCLNYFVWVEEPQVVEPQTVQNGGTIQPVGNQGLYEFKSKYGYKLSYNPKYKVDLSGSMYDFYISNADNTVNVQITPMPKDESITSITTKEQWDAAMGDLGECMEFNRTSFNGMDALIAHYILADEKSENVQDVLVATLIGEEKSYTYCYTASNKASELEAQQIGGILYTISEWKDENHD